jgi:cytochrome c oxidase subunit III
MSDSDHDHSHAGHGHGEAVYPYTPHHFHAAKQHFESGKMGVWLFLVTEILFFAGLFCAYTVYRARHPEVFYWAHFYLDTTLGAANTVVLILSSFTAAWAVRNAQMGDKTKLRINILLTIAGALFFMCVKYVEYSHKFHDGLLPSRHFHPSEEVWETHAFKHKHPEAAAAAERIIALRTARMQAQGAVRDEVVPRDAALRAVPVSHHEEGAPAAAPPHFDKDELALDVPNDIWLESQIRALPPAVRKPLDMAGVIHKPADGPVEFARPAKAGVFFSIYFFMTGLHGLHVVIGIGLWIWMLVIASKRSMGDRYFGPIDFTALYWHLVDLIWIYLFPMLYLIH